MAGSWGELLVGIKVGSTPSATSTTGGTAANAPVECPGGRMVFAAVAFGAATAVKVQMLGPDGTTFIDTPTTSALSAAGSILFDLPPCYIQAVITGSPTAMFASIARVVG